MDQLGKCPIWSTSAETTPNGDIWHILSPRAGGKFSISGTAIALLEPLDDIDRAKLTNWLVSQRLQGNLQPYLDSGIIESAKRSKPLSFSARIDRLLLWYQFTAKTLGEAIQVYDQGSSKLTLDFQTLQAWIGTANDDEYYRLRDLINGSDLIRNDMPHHVSLTRNGYERLEQLEKAWIPSGQAFVAMWFDASMSEAYTHGIASGISPAGYSPMRIDQKDHANKIDDEIIAEIRRSRFVVADFTSGALSDANGRTHSLPRGGVYDEAGFAQGLGLPVIWTCRLDCISQVHFDTRQFNHITWETPEELGTKLNNRIRSVLGEGPVKQ